MITFDMTHKQVLTTACLNCKDPYFAPAKPSMVHVGCCSYSPVFSLFEINQMIKDKKRHYFIDRIYNHQSATVEPYSVVIHSKIHPLFYELNNDHLTEIEKEDMRLQYSVCQFFIREKGCALHASYKNATCRSFICLTLEEQLDSAEKTQLKAWNNLIHKEVHSFNKQHQAILQLRKINLQHNVQQVLDYLQFEVK